MSTLREIVIDLTAAAKRGALTDEEFRRFLGYVVENHTGPVTQSRLETTENGALSARAPARARVEANGRRTQRQYLGRGKYGWVDTSRARELNL